MNLGPSLFIASLLTLYKESAVNAAKQLRQNWLLIVGSILAYFLFIFTYSILLVGLGVAGRFLAGILKLSLMTLYYSWITATFNREKLTARSLLHFDWGIFFTLIGTSFVLWIVEHLISPFGQVEEGRAFYACAQLGIFLLLNALPEVIVVMRLDGLVAVNEAISFCIRNWIEWFIPLLVLFLPLLLGNPYEVLIIMSGLNPFTDPPDPLLPPLVLVSYLSGYLQTVAPWLGLVGTVLAVGIASWFMVFRALLFEKLNSSSRRKRLYDAKFK